MKVCFSKASILGEGSVCLQLGDGINHYIHPDNAPLVLRELKAAMGVDDNDQDALIAELVGALETALDAIKAAPPDSWGMAGGGEDGVWPIQDELIHRIGKTLAKASGGEAK